MKSLTLGRRSVNLDSLKDMFLEEISGHSTRATKWMLEYIMEDERALHMDQNACHQDRSRKDYRNGYYTRELRSKVGLLTGLRVPRTRSGEFYPTVLDKYARVARVVEKGISTMYLRGVSTANVGAVLHALLGYEVSAGKVSMVNRSLDKLVRDFQGDAIHDDVMYLFLDGIYLKDRSLLKSRKRPILVAYGVRANGKREFLHFRIAKSEGELEWTKFLNELRARGLSGKQLRLIVTDGGGGLIAALDNAYPGVGRQRCWVHKMRNISNKVRRGDEKECLDGARKIYSAPHRRAALQAFRRWASRWARVYPKAVRVLERDLEHLLVFFSMPPAHHKLLRTTNVIERGFGEVRRRTKVMGALPNQKSINRIVYARLCMLNNRWSHVPKFVRPAPLAVGEVAA